MIRSFRDAETRAIFEGESTKAARRRLPAWLWRKAQLKLDEIDVATDPRQLNTPSNRLHKLAGDRAGQHAIRIDRRYRICFRWAEGDAWDVEVTDYH